MTPIISGLVADRVLGQRPRGLSLRHPALPLDQLHKAKLAGTPHRYDARAAFALIVALWAWQAKRAREPSTVIKIAIGSPQRARPCGAAVAAFRAGVDKASWLWLFFHFVVISIGELYMSPTALPPVSNVARGRSVSTLMGVWPATSFAGRFLAGWLGGFWSTMAKGDFFLMIAAIAGTAGMVIIAGAAPLKQILRE